jgi:hypothetical protein
VNKIIYAPKMHNSQHGWGVGRVGLPRVPRPTLVGVQGMGECLAVMAVMAALHCSHISSCCLSPLVVLPTFLERLQSIRGQWVVSVFACL